MRDIAQVFFEPSGSVQENSILYPILTLSYSAGDYGRITNRNGGFWGEQAASCSSRQPAANRFRAHIRLAKEDIRRSGRMQQAGSLRAPDPRLRSRQCEIIAMSTSAGQRERLHYQSD